MINSLTMCRDEHCPSKLMCKRYGPTQGLGDQDFHREEDAVNCTFFVNKET